MKTKTKIIGSFVQGLILSAVTAFGHGSMADPISRSYEVFLENPDTPISEAAKAAIGVGGTQPFYDWMEVRRQIPDYNYPAVIPDGKLPGVGLDKYAGLNLVRTDWPATKVVPGPRLCRFYATTVHDPSFFKAYITREGYNPREALRWADLVELPGAEATTLSGSNNYMTLNLPVRTGRHILYVIWQRIDPVGEVFFSTSDLDFGGVDYGVALNPVTAPPASTTLVDPATHTHVDSSAVTFSYVNQWTSGGQGLFHINNTSVDATRGWTLEFDYAGEITSLWEGVISSRLANHYVIRNADYNGVIPTGGIVDVGFVANFTTAGLQPTGILFNGVSTTVPVLSVSTLALNSVTVGTATSQTLAASGGTTPYNWSVTTGTLPEGLTLSSAGVLSGTPTMAGTASFTVQVKDSVAAVATRDLALTVASSSTPVTPPVTPPVTLPTLAVGDATLTLSAPTSAVTTNGYLSASGNQIVDAAGNPVRIAGVNWFGFETGNKVFHGLWTRGYKSMLDQVKGLGFNTLRIPYSNEMLRSDAVTTSINYAQNPDLQGLTPIQCLDKVIDYAGSIGLKVILDRHSAKADGYIGEDVWYIPGDAYYTEQRWIDDWVMLAKRYSGNATVIGADLFNEPKKSATWGNSAPATDWNKAAERAGNAILAANPNWLIIVEGTEQYNGQTTWWGGNLKGVATYPVVLAKPSKLVYSMHDYPASVFAQTWFSDPAYPKNLADVWYAHWGYIFKNQTAPLLLGEFGSKLLTTSDQQWMDKLTDYIDGDLNLDGVKDLTGNQKGMSWTYWSLNPNSGDTGGILNDDWTTVNSLRMSYIQGSLAPLIGVATGSGVTSQTMNFAVTLSAPASAVVSVAYATVDGTAAAGVNYTATSGTLFFAPGETMKTISVVVPGQTLTANKQFTVQLGNVSGATIADGTGAGLIQPAAVVLPAVPVISSAATASGTVGTAFSYQIVASGSPTSYSATGLPAGLTVDATSGVISGTPTAAAASTVTLKATNAGGSGTKTLTITVVAASVTGTLTVLQTIQNDWGTGFTAQVVISNPTSAAVSNWSLGFTFDGKITDIWSAAVASQAGTKWVVSPVAWTSTIPAGGSVTFGYNGTPGTTYKIPVAFLINGTAAGRTTNEGTAVAPVISSAATASGTVGTAFSYQIVASGSPTSYSATGLPAGLTVNATSGVISGTPTATATSTVTLKATNAVGSATKTLTITVAAAPVVTAPVISSATTASGTVGTAFSYQIVASGSPTSYSATGLPAGLTVNATSGLISGTPTVAATSSVALKASNTGGSGSSGLTITIGTALPVVVPGYDKMPTVEQRKIVGYYPNWGIYQKGFPVTKIRGDRMNVINYAFLIPLDRTMPTAWDRIVSSYRGWKYSNYAAYMQQPPGTTLTAGVGLFDEYADAGANSAAEALTMSPAYTTNSNFGQLQVLKKQYPKLKTMVSIGGWTLSAPLYSISRDAQKRADFAKSAVYVIVKYGFDGIDIDWEYPGGGGLDGSGVASTSDGANYNLLLKAIRDEMNRQTAIDGKKYYLSIAGPGGDQNIANFDPKAVSQIADWINIMTYDFHGGWDSYTGINAPMENIDPSAGRANWSVKGATQVYLNGLNGKGGVPAAQLVVGVPFYGRGWDGVQAGPKGDGLGQAGYEATSPGLGETEFPYNSLFSSGVLTYANGVFAGAGGYQRYWNAKAQVPYLYSATAKRFITYDDSESMRVKADYANQLGLGGLMFWELSEDVTMGSTSLLDSIYDRVHLP
jgi:GH18 family chitinase/aryl-phospho-beta-D-glucosidase BglC (GH1 family)/predicted carbohydrate-binding protein with CBM5 and CBM33 domain